MDSMEGLALALYLAGPAYEEEPVAPPGATESSLVCNYESCDIKPFIATGVDLSEDWLGLNTRFGLDFLKPDSERNLSASFRVGAGLRSPNLADELNADWLNMGYYSFHLATALAVEHLGERGGFRWTVVDLEIPFNFRGAVFSTNIGTGLALNPEPTGSVWLYGRVGTDLFDVSQIVNKPFFQFGVTVIGRRGLASS